MGGIVRKRSRFSSETSGMLPPFSALVIAFSLVLYSQYWKVDEHVVFALILLLTGSLLLSSSLAQPSFGGFTPPLYLYFGFCSWILLSAFWSPTPHLSLSYGLLVLFVALTAVLQGFLWDLRSLALGIFLGVLLVAAHAAFLELFSSDRLAVLSSTGLFTNPSSLSFLLGIGLLGAVFSLPQNRSMWVPLICFGFLALAWLSELGVLTPYFALGSSAAVLLAVLHLRRVSLQSKGLLLWVYASLATLGGLMTWYFREAIFFWSGEDGSSLGERIPLWEAYIEAVSWRPLLGSGWGVTVGWDFPLSRDRLAPVFEWFPAHNGYLDIALMLGLVGLLLFLAALASLFIGAVRITINHASTVRSAFLPVLIVYLLVNDLVSTSFPKLVGLFLVGLMVGNMVRTTQDNPALS